MSDEIQSFWIDRGTLGLSSSAASSSSCDCDVGEIDFIWMCPPLPASPSLRLPWSRRRFMDKPYVPKPPTEEERMCFQRQDHYSYCLRPSLYKQGFKRLVGFQACVPPLSRCIFSLFRRPRFAPLPVRSARTYAAAWSFELRPVQRIGGAARRQ